MNNIMNPTIACKHCHRWLDKLDNEDKIDYWCDLCKQAYVQKGDQIYVSELQKNPSILVTNGTSQVACTGLIGDIELVLTLYRQYKCADLHPLAKEVLKALL